MMLKHDMSRTIVLTVIRDVDRDEERYVIDDGETGLDIRHESKCKLDADVSTTHDLEISHCEACYDEMSIADVLGLSDDEADLLTRWRTRKQDGISSAKLGDILDKVVRAIARRPIECSSRHERIVLKVEPTP